MGRIGIGDDDGAHFGPAYEIECGGGSLGTTAQHQELHLYVLWKAVE